MTSRLLSGITPTELCVPYFYLVLASLKQPSFLQLVSEDGPAKSGWQGLQAAMWKQRRASIQGLQTRVLPVFRNQTARKYPPNPNSVSSRLGTKPESFV